ncbi:MAG: hypothetical protein ACH37Z_00100 [Anaerolineae bacterium]
MKHHALPWILAASLVAACQAPEAPTSVPAVTEAPTEAVATDMAPDTSAAESAAGGPVCVDFEPPLAVGTRYGTPAGQAPGTLIFNSHGIDVRVRDFVFTGSGGTFGEAGIEPAPATFGMGQVMAVNNINLELDFSGLGAPVTEVALDYLDMGGFENLTVNGQPAAIYAGELSAAPSPIGAVALSFAPPVMVVGGKTGRMTATGPIAQLQVGGQEFWIDSLCATLKAGPQPIACPNLHAPQDAIDAAIAHPEAVAGWGELCNPGVPFDPLNNGYRTALNLQNPNLAYNPVTNGLVFKCGCR